MTKKDRLERLLYELTAINVWDLDFLGRNTHDAIDSAAWEARRNRTTEIHEELDQVTRFPLVSD